MKRMKWNKQGSKDSTTVVGATGAQTASATAKYRTPIFVAVSVLVAVSIVYLLWQQRANESSVDKTPPYTITDEQYAKVHLSTLKNDPPAENAPVAEKKTYYDELATNEYEAKNYQGVVSTYETASALFKETDLTFNMYIAAAQSYAKLGNKPKALSVLDIADQFVGATTSDAALASDFRKSIAYFREELAR